VEVKKVLTVVKMVDQLAACNTLLRYLLDDQRVDLLVVQEGDHPVV